MRRNRQRKVPHQIDRFVWFCLLFACLIDFGDGFLHYGYLASPSLVKPQQASDESFHYHSTHQNCDCQFRLYVATDKSTSSFQRISPSLTVPPLCPPSTDPQANQERVFSSRSHSGRTKTKNKKMSTSQNGKYKYSPMKRMLRAISTSIPKDLHEIHANSDNNNNNTFHVAKVVGAESKVVGQGEKEHIFSGLFEETGHLEPPEKLARQGRPDEAIDSFCSLVAKHNMLFTTTRNTNTPPTIFEDPAASMAVQWACYVAQKWLDYDESTSQLIETAQTRGDRCVNITVNDANYYIDFCEMLQKDESRGINRKIRRFAIKNRNIKRKLRSDNEVHDHGHGTNRGGDNYLLQMTNSLLIALGDRGHLEHAEIIFDMLDSLNIKKDLTTYTTMISKAGAWQSVELAEKYFQLLMTNSGNLRPNAKAYNCLINAYAKVGNLQAAMDTLTKMEGMNIRASVVTFNTLLDAVARKGDIPRAQSIFKMMDVRNIIANDRSYSSLIHTSCQVGNMDLALAIIDHMQSLGIRPNAVTYSLILHGFGNAGDLDKAFEVLGLMRDNDLKPNVVTMSSLVHNYGRHGSLDQAFFIYDEMMKSQDPTEKPNSITCSSLIDSCLKADEIDLAFGVLKDMRTYNIPLNEVTYTSLITELTRLKMVDRLLDVFKMQQPEGHGARTPPVMRSWKQEINAMSARSHKLDLPESDILDQMKTYHRQGDYEGVIQLFNNLKEAGQEFASTRIYRLLMEAVFEKSKITNTNTISRNSHEGSGSSSGMNKSNEEVDPVVARQNELFRLYLVLQEMRIAGIQVDTATYNTLINACAAAGEVEKALETVESMQNDGVAPDVITYTSLIKACAIRSNRDTIRSGSGVDANIAESLFTEMQQKANHFSSYIEPTELTYSRLMQVNLACNKTGRVWDLFALMKDRYLSPSVYSYRSCLQTAVKDRNVEKGFEILNEIRPYPVQQRLGLQYNSIPEFYIEMWATMIELLEETKVSGRSEELHERFIRSLKDEMQVLGKAGQR